MNDKAESSPLTLVSLVSEQTVPNLLPLLHLQPAQALLVHTSSDYSSKKPAQRLQKLLPSEVETQLLQVDAYRVDKIQQKLANVLTSTGKVVFNLTGGTKPMTLAAFQTARHLEAMCIYYRTEGERERGQQSVLYWYDFDERGELRFQRREPLPSLLTLDLYLRSYVGEYEIDVPKKTTDVGSALENAVAEALRGEVDELMRNVRPKGVKHQAEVDLLIRKGNNVAVLEIKSGGEGSSKKALDQLTTVAAREYLGTYARRVLITRSNQDVRSSWYRALANALRVEVVELQHGLQNGRLYPQDARNLQQRIRLILP